MNDENLEHYLRNLPASELPEAWRAEILSAALREVSRTEGARPVWPSILVYLRNMFARNPVTSGALATLWLLIFLFKAGTPVDPVSERMALVHIDSNRPVYLVSIQDEIRLVDLMQEPVGESPTLEPRQIP